MNKNIDINQLMQAAVQQQQMRGTERRGLSYCEILSLILVVMWCMGHLACPVYVPFIPLAVPFVVYGCVFLIGYIAKKFFKK